VGKALSPARATAQSVPTKIGLGQAQLDVERALCPDDRPVNMRDAGRKILRVDRGESLLARVEADRQLPADDAAEEMGRPGMRIAHELAGKRRVRPLVGAMRRRGTARGSRYTHFLLTHGRVGEPVPLLKSEDRLRRNTRWPHCYADFQCHFPGKDTEIHVLPHAEFFRGPDSGRHGRFRSDTQ
jgi:hypothetical protein